MVGDSQTDVAASQAAKIPVVAVTFGYTPEPVATFGPDRLMFGGDWPVATLAVTARQWLDEVDWALRGLSEDERCQIYAGTAQRFYRIATAVS